MASWKRLLVTALVVGFAASVVLAAIEALHHSDIIGVAQFPGIVIAWEVAYGGSTFAVEVVMVLVNAVCYSALFGGLLLLVRTVEKALVHD
jgi:hypothetical protein